MKQINENGARRQRGRPKKEGELKQSSVRIRPALKAKLEAAAECSGESIARELETRLESSFSEAPTREVTAELLARIAHAVADLDATGRHWNTDLTAWAMVREILANGPILEAIPHPDPAKAKELTAKNSQIVALQIERDAISRALLMGGVSAMGEDIAQMLGARYTGLRAGIDRNAAREAIMARDDLPADIREGMLAQVARLEELDAEIDKLRQQVAQALAPYISAKEAARRFIYDLNGAPELPLWVTAPEALNEPPPRRAPLPELRPTLAQ